jgi:hypothetical protein
VWTLKKRDRNRIRTAEIKYLRIDKGCSRPDQLENEHMRNELDIFPLYCDMMAESRNSGTRAVGRC